MKGRIKYHRSILSIMMALFFGAMLPLNGWGQISLDRNVSLPAQNSPTGQIKEDRQPSEEIVKRLTFTSGESKTPRIAVDDYYIYSYIVWCENTGSHFDVFWQKSVFGEPVTELVNLSNSAANSEHPAIGIDDAGNSYIVWLENTSNSEVYAIKLGPDGQVLVPPFVVSSGTNYCPDIAVDSLGMNYISYQLWDEFDKNVRIKRFDADFQPICELEFENYSSGEFFKNPAITISKASGENRAGIIWRDIDTSLNENLFFNASTVICNSVLIDFLGDYDYPAMGTADEWMWTEMYAVGNVYNSYNISEAGEAQVNDVTGTALAPPRVSDDPDSAYVVWSDTRDGNDEIYLTTAFLDFSSPDVRITDNVGSSLNPDIDTPHSLPGYYWIVWQDDRDGNWEIYFHTNWIHVYVCGDANDDENVNIVDITYLINHLYLAGPAADPPEAADVNSDGAVNLLDITYLIDYLYLGGPEPECP